MDNKLELKKLEVKYNDILKILTDCKTGFEKHLKNANNSISVITSETNIRLVDNNIKIVNWFLEDLKKLLKE